VKIAEEQLQSAKRAVWAYERALEAMPGYRPAIDALARLRNDQGAWRELTRDLEREAGAAVGALW